MFEIQSPIVSCMRQVGINVNLAVLPCVEISQNEKGRTTISFCLPYGFLSFLPFSEGEMLGTGSTRREWFLHWVREELELRCSEEVVNLLMKQIDLAIDQLNTERPA